MSPSPRYDANCSILFTELPLPERPAAAAAAGFDAVEFWWPFDTAVPTDADVDGFATAIEDAGVSLVSLNFTAGDMARGDRGLVSLPGRSAEFRASVDTAVAIGERLGCRAFNALYGLRLDGVAADAQDETAAENLTYAAQAASRIGANVVIEPLSGFESYPVKTAADAAGVLDRLPDADNLRILFDIFHLAVNGDDVDAAIKAHVSRIGHVQIADAPGRGEPGSGRLDLHRYVLDLYAAGYQGWVGLEYVPTVPSAESFGWLTSWLDGVAGTPTSQGGTS